MKAPKKPAKKCGGKGLMTKAMDPNNYTKGSVRGPKGTSSK